jgi:hypothetical protein
VCNNRLYQVKELNQMKLSNAVKKLEAQGFQVTVNSFELQAVKGNQIIGSVISRDDQEVNSFYSKDAGSQSDGQRDYFVETWHKNLTQAIIFVESWLASHSTKPTTPEHLKPENMIKAFNPTISDADLAAKVERFNNTFFQKEVNQDGDVRYTKVEAIAQPEIVEAIAPTLPDPVMIENQNLSVDQIKEALPITKDFGLGSAMVFRGELITTWAYEFDFDAYGVSDRMIIEAGLIQEAIADQPIPQIVPSGKTTYIYSHKELGEYSFQVWEFSDKVGVYYSGSGGLFWESFKASVNRSEELIAKGWKLTKSINNGQVTNYPNFQAEQPIAEPIQPEITEAEEAIAPLPIQELEQEAIAVPCEVETPYKVMIQLSMISYVQPVRYTPEALKPMQLSLV